MPRRRRKRDTPRLLDTYCGQGGASEGYSRAGFTVVGVDLHPQPNYPFDFHQGDAIEFIRDHGHEFDAIVASPPCQAFTLAQRIQQRKHPDLIAETRHALMGTGLPWVIENVEGAPLRQDVLLCGAMFSGLRTYRHRVFESSVPLAQPEHPAHTIRTTKMGRPPREGEFMHIVGNFSGVAEARKAMGIDWMTRDGLREAIPPAFTQYVGGFLRLAIT